MTLTQHVFYSEWLDHPHISLSRTLFPHQILFYHEYISNWDPRINTQFCILLFFRIIGLEYKIPMKLLRDFKPGPLDFYRKKASFDWKKLKVLLDSEDLVDFQVSYLRFRLIPTREKKYFRMKSCGNWWNILIIR